MRTDQQKPEARFIEENWFQDFGEGFVLAGNHCPSCNRTFFPKKPVCPECFSSELKDVPLSKRGTLHTYALSVMGPADIEKPYVIGFIDMPERIKLYSIIIECEPWDKVLKVGMEMEMVIDAIKQDEDGVPLLGYKFRPVEKGVSK